VTASGWVWCIAPYRLSVAIALLCGNKQTFLARVPGRSDTRYMFTTDCFVPRALVPMGAGSIRIVCCATVLIAARIYVIHGVCLVRLLGILALGARTSDCSQPL